MTVYDIALTGRRDVLRLVVTALCAPAIVWKPVYAQAADDGGPVAPIERLDAALLAAMKAGQRTSFEQRFATLAPVIEHSFDLEAVLAASVGVRWPTLLDEQKSDLRAAYRRYTVSSYAANSDSYKARHSSLLRRCAL